MFASLIATEFIRNIIPLEDSLPIIHNLESREKIKFYLEQTKNSDYRSLLLREYTSYIKMFNYTGQKAKTNNLIQIYKETFPKDPPLFSIEKNPLAIIKEVGDFLNFKRPFSIKKDTVVTVFSAGEFDKEIGGSPWTFDNVEIFLDLKNEKNTIFENKNNRQYRFNYDYPVLSGMYSTSSQIEFVQSDPVQATYMFEIRMPWETLDSIIPAPGKKIGFDISVTDNDGSASQDKVSWNYINGERPWENPSVFGTMQLCSKAENNTTDSICFSVKAHNPVKLDGIIDKAWKSVPKYQLKNTDKNNKLENKDLSAWFKSTWDENYLYFLVEVTDDNKNILPLTGDYGWIENEHRDTIWSMKMNNTQFAGGAPSNRFSNTEVPLKAGNYVLKYSSNQVNSFDRWINKRPDINFYGIVVY